MAYRGPIQEEATFVDVRIQQTSFLLNLFERGLCAVLLAGISAVIAWDVRWLALVRGATHRLRFFSGRLPSSDTCSRGCHGLLSSRALVHRVRPRSTVTAVRIVS